MAELQNMINEHIESNIITQKAINDKIQQNNKINNEMLDQLHKTLEEQGNILNKMLFEIDQIIKESSEAEKIQDTITNMEDIKRAFFNKDYNTAFEQIKLTNLRLFKGNYKFNDDKDGAPEFVAKNLLRGFEKNFEDNRKYFMICFRCFKTSSSNEPNKYVYQSYWIINTNKDLESVVGSIYEDYEFEEVVDKDQFLNNIIKLDEDTPTLIGQIYVH